MIISPKKDKFSRKGKYALLFFSFFSVLNVEMHPKVSCWTRLLFIHWSSMRTKRDQLSSPTFKYIYIYIYDKCKFAVVLLHYMIAYLLFVFFLLSPFSAIKAGHLWSFSRMIGRFIYPAEISFERAYQSNG